MNDTQIERLFKAVLYIFSGIIFSLVIAIVIVVLAFLYPDTVHAKEGGTIEGHIHRAEFTGYYPESSAMEGGYRDVSGEWLDPTECTVAAPRCIPLGSRIIIGGTGNWRDGYSYEVTDRGGAIVVDEDGVYHIDILMSCPEQANNFGRVQGYIIVEEE